MTVVVGVVNTRHRDVVFIDTSSAESVDEHATKLLSQCAVQDKVDGTVNVDQEVPDDGQNLVAVLRLNTLIVYGKGEVVD